MLQRRVKYLFRRLVKLFVEAPTIIAWHVLSAADTNVTALTFAIFVAQFPLVPKANTVIVCEEFLPNLVGSSHQLVEAPCFLNFRFAAPCFASASARSVSLPGTYVFVVVHR